jgi:hypothetical protein
VLSKAAEKLLEEAAIRSLPATFLIATLTP